MLEGYVDVDELRREGPFGDHTGYYSLADDYPVFHLTAITRRENPIYATTVVGPPPQEDAWLGKATERLFLPLLQMTFPEIVDMNLPIEGVFHNLCIVSIKKEYPHHARKICHSLWGMGQMMFAKCIIVVDDDVNVQDVREVAWRALNNIDAKRDVFFAEGPIDVLDHASAAFGFGGKLGVDATRKWKEEGFTREWPEVLKMDPAVDARVDALLQGAGAVTRRRHRTPASPRRAPTSAACSTASRGATTRPTGSMSAGVDVVWRKKAIARLLEGLGETPRLLDLGAGTLDGALEIARRVPGARVAAADFAREMLRAGRPQDAGRRRTSTPTPPTATTCPTATPPSTARSRPSASATSPTCRAALRELRRVVRPGGRVVHPRVPAPRAPALLLRPHLQRARAAADRLGRHAAIATPTATCPSRSAASARRAEFAALLREVGFANGRDARRCSRRASRRMVVAS